MRFREFRSDVKLYFTSGAPSCAARRAGMRNPTRAPGYDFPPGVSDGGLYARITPPNARTTPWTNARPSPAPPCMRVAVPSTW